ncbi:Uncharacterised protein [uncultured Comamonas sp.]|nr:Uncharacterised protein [uncultured Comamonas sp.]
MLHFVNDQIFPIWDSRIESFRIQAKPTNPHMSDPVNYLAFIRDVNAIRLEPSFQSFYTEFQAVYFDRQQAMGIPLYRISEVRAIEAAAFELA